MARNDSRLMDPRRDTGRAPGSGSTRYYLSQIRKDAMTQTSGTNPGLYTNLKKKGGKKSK